eukprot:Phypoly_transcript_01544.p1 GENE.Phypoly_transcript_01544~~Phypoly_transcript_01544.p1  ORF type:complete len:1030 (+),score=135.85 Phypoly_transcript_01544:65-3091(+)
MTSVYSFGQGSFGQLGHGEEDDQTKPKIIAELRNTRVIKLACGARHSAAITDNGVLFTWGSNEDGELGRSRRLMIPQRVDALESQIVVSVACGDKHTACTTDSGEVFTWGGNASGQLGHGDNEPSGKPRVVKDLRPSFISSVACGAAFTLAMSRKGEIFAFGDGTYGQLGKGDLESRRWPVPVEKLAGVPIVQIDCGDQFSMALTVSGNVYSWGNNKFGQLGLGDSDTRSTPTLVRALRGKHIVQIACGAHHTIARSDKETIFSWGSGAAGQLGHGETGHETSPRPILALAGYDIGGIACGRRHSLAFRTGARPRMVYTWGTGPSGQLGLGNRQPHDTPTPVEADELTNKPILDAACGGEHTLVLASEATLDAASAAKYHKRSALAHLDLHDIRSLVDNVVSSGKITPLIEAIELVFSSPGSLNASFLKQTEHFDAAPSVTGVDLFAVREAYHKILALPAPYAERAHASLISALNTLLARFKTISTETNEDLRLYLIILENPLFLTPSRTTLPVVEKLVTAILGLPQSARQTLLRWWSEYPSEYFVRLVDLFQRTLAYLMRMEIPGPVVSVTSILNDLHNVNEAQGIVPYEKFYNHEVCETINLAKDYEQWRSSKNVFSFCRYPFLLTAQAKASILQIDANLQQQLSFHESIIHASDPFFVLRVRRDQIISDTLTQIAQHPPWAFKKPLKVVFEGEAGVDEGGVRKEYFQLVTRNLFDLQYGMFIKDELSHLYWFNMNSLETIDRYILIGAILGLAIYNGVILNVHFPMVVYKKLMHIKPNLKDLKELHPMLGRSLQEVLDFTGDVEQAFDLTFQSAYEKFGETQYYDLKPDGANIPVTNKNRQEYVDLYVDWYFNKSVGTQFEAFASGWRTLLSGDVLQMFRPEELSLLVCGSSEELDFSVLERVTHYAGDYTPETPVIKWFWSVAHGWSSEQKKRFLAFTTGSDRVPISGLGSVPLVIQRNGPDSDHLPTASTCYNVLLLPEYSSREKLDALLTSAINNFEGFGLA